MRISYFLIDRRSLISSTSLWFDSKQLKNNLQPFISPQTWIESENCDKIIPNLPSLDICFVDFFYAEQQKQNQVVNVRWKNMPRETWTENVFKIKTHESKLSCEEEIFSPRALINESVAYVIRSVRSFIAPQTLIVCNCSCMELLVRSLHFTL